MVLSIQLFERRSVPFLLCRRTNLSKAGINTVSNIRQATWQYPLLQLSPQALSAWRCSAAVSYLPNSNAYTPSPMNST